MVEHAIRLRAAWDCRDLDGESEATRRVDLPTDWPSGSPSRFLLRRKFGRPPGIESVQSIYLELLKVPGLVAAQLNGRDLLPNPAEASAWVIPLGEPLPSRSVLILEVDFRDQPGPHRDWGAIALIIASPGPSPP
ncbi:hypothetical protein P12x_001903 [Tundrisphaera lichenicola]|uniref:hypothetical protein n=1 Tax=Tundrisphaera lichenicola TaxID=2029860 RepID=UPI003EBB1DA4